jgi:hypothetical protein
MSIMEDVMKGHYPNNYYIKKAAEYSFTEKQETIKFCPKCKHTWSSSYANRGLRYPKEVIPSYGKPRLLCKECTNGEIIK